MRILLLTDYCGSFYSSAKNIKTLCTMDIDKIVSYFESEGFEVEVKGFWQVDLTDDYENVYVVYTSCEDYELKYKGFIEDIIFALEEKGAIVLPEYKYLKAHHNKAFMEMLAKSLFPERNLVLDTHIFGTYEELEKAKLSDKKYVIKASFGAGSKGVKLANNKAELLKAAKKISKSCELEDLLREYKHRLLWKGYHFHSLNRNKFIVQNFVSNLEGDFKVLKYGDRYYPLYRKNRENDFRASGGGRLSFDLPDSVDIQELLSFSKSVAQRLNTPLCSLDIAFDGEKFILIEYQCICFGPVAAEKSERYYCYEGDTFKQIKEKCDLEKIFCQAMTEWIRNIQNEEAADFNLS